MVDGRKAIIGSHHFVFEDEKCTIPVGKEELFRNLPEEYSHLYLGIEGKLAAVICIEDPLRPEAPEVIKQLRKAGFTQIVMMTGDSDRTAKAIAARVGVDKYYSEVLPEDKAKFVEEAKAQGRKVLMVGEELMISGRFLQQMLVLRSVMEQNLQEKLRISRLGQMI